MNTIKVGTRLKGQPVQNEAARLEKREAECRALRQVVAAIRKVDPAVVDDAVDAILRVADDYRASTYLVDSGGQRSVPSLKTERQSIGKLLKNIEAVRHDIANLPLSAFSALAFGYKAPVGRLKIEIDRIWAAALAAQLSLNERPNKQPDYARIFLAFQVAVVFRDILKQKPSSASDKSIYVNMKRGGAAYARVLRATLEICGVAKYDPGPLIASSLSLLKAPYLPSNQ